MLRGIYSAASAMLAAFQRQEQTAANLANINTPGYKRDTFVARSAPSVTEVRNFEGLLSVAYPTRPFPLKVGEVGTGVLNDPVITDFSDGDVRESGRELDLALIGPGYYEMRSADGATFYSRDGQFSRDSAGRLVDAHGNFVVGNDGPIVVGFGSVTVAADGSVYADGQPVGQMWIREFPVDTPLRKTGNGNFIPVDPNLTPAFSDGGTIVQQGAIEYSNVDPSRAVAEMLSATRSYEAAQRILQMSDAILERSVNDIGRV